MNNIKLTSLFILLKEQQVCDDIINNSICLDIIITNLFNDFGKN